MKMSTKGRYAVTALADIALQDVARPVTLAEIAERQDISVPYLEQLFAKLRRAGLVISTRGPGGGYRLAQDAGAITIARIMVAVDESLRATKCVGSMGEGCAGDRARCLTHNLWEAMSSHVHLFLQQTTLADVIDDTLAPCPAVPDFTAMIPVDEGAA